MRNERTQQLFNNAIYRAKRWGLTDGQRKVLHGLDTWFKRNPDGPSTNELAATSEVSPALVYWTLPVLEHLGYITFSRHRSGHRVARSIRLWVDPDTVGKAS